MDDIELFKLKHNDFIKLLLNSDRFLSIAELSLMELNDNTDVQSPSNSDIDVIDVFVNDCLLDSNNFEELSKKLMNYVYHKYMFIFKSISEYIDVMEKLLTDLNKINKDFLNLFIFKSIIYFILSSPNELLINSKIPKLNVATNKYKLDTMSDLNVLAKDLRESYVKNELFIIENLVNYEMIKYYSS